MLELKTSDRDDGCSLSTLSPFGWDHGVLRHKKENRVSKSLFLIPIITVQPQH